MSIKNQLVRLAEKITGRKCCRCAHNCGGTCAHPNGTTFTKCWQSLTRPGFEERQEQKPGDLTDEEKHQMQKIVASLQEASETARNGGLLGAHPEKAVPADQDDRTESGLLEEE